jgi:nucleotide-binding universal stress UspA family protein
MLKLLIPFDGSPSASNAVRFALRMAAREGGAMFHLVHVHEPPRVYGEIAVYADAEKIRQLQRAHGSALLADAEKILSEARAVFTRAILEGDVAASIAAEADRIGCDAIVMGTRGMSPIGNLVMGSTAAKVVHAARQPVILVK